MISVVVPVRDEKDCIEGVVEGVEAVLDGEHEIIVVDDGSTDNTFKVLKRLSRKYPSLHCTRLSKKHGQTAALKMGFDRARGGVIVSLDGDGQFNPADIPRLTEKLSQGFDVACGWRRNRKYSIPRIVLSKITNTLGRIFMGVHLNDFSCTLRAYRAESVKDIPLRGSMHRYLPGVLARNGSRITEVEVGHRPRAGGVSKYGMGRVLTGSIDFLLNYYSLNPFSAPEIQVLEEF